MGDILRDATARRVDASRNTANVFRYVIRLCAPRRVVHAMQRDLVRFVGGEPLMRQTIYRCFQTMLCMHRHALFRRYPQAQNILKN
jgi:hypothetical protein